MQMVINIVFIYSEIRKLLQVRIDVWNCRIRLFTEGNDSTSEEFVADNELELELTRNEI